MDFRWEFSPLLTKRGDDGQEKQIETAASRKIRPKRTGARAAAGRKSGPPGEKTEHPGRRGKYIGTDLLPATGNRLILFVVRNCLPGQRAVRSCGSNFLQGTVCRFFPRLFIFYLRFFCRSCSSSPRTPRGRCAERDRPESRGRLYSRGRAKRTYPAPACRGCRKCRAVFPVRV